MYQTSTYAAGSPTELLREIGLTPERIVDVVHREHQLAPDSVDLREPAFEPSRKGSS